MITHISVQGKKGNYLFEIFPPEEGSLSIGASCTQPNGGLNTCADDWNELAEMLVDCVETWEDE